jgi:limonene-1,2-epoxide hydrolase
MQSSQCSANDLTSTLTSKMASTLENQKATVKSLFDALNRADADGVIALRTTECTHNVMPSTIAHTRTNDEHRAYLGQMFKMANGFTVRTYRHEPTSRILQQVLTRFPNR